MVCVPFVGHDAGLPACLPPGSPAAREALQPAAASEVASLLAKVAAIAEAAGMSGADSRGGGAQGSHGRRRLPLGHIRAVLARAQINTWVRVPKEALVHHVDDRSEHCWQQCLPGCFLLVSHGLLASPACRLPARRCLSTACAADTVADPAEHVIKGRCVKLLCDGPSM